MPAQLNSRRLPNNPLDDQSVMLPKPTIGAFAFALQRKAMTTPDRTVLSMVVWAQFTWDAFLLEAVMGQPVIGAFDRALDMF